MTHAQTMFGPTTLYPNVRAMLSPGFAHLSDAELESAFESAFGEGVSPAEYEEFFGGLGRALGSVGRDLGRFAGQAAPVVASALPGVIQGATTGAALGPWGALGGAIAGGVGSALSRHGRGPARDVGNVLGGVVNTAGALTGRGAAGGALAGLLGGAGGGAAGQLLGLLRRPETLQAVQSLAGGSNRAVPVGGRGTPVPASAFAGLLGALAREAEAEQLPGEALSEPPAYLMNASGQFVVDPSDPDGRAARLLQMLQAAPPPPRRVRPVLEAYDEADESGEFDEAEEDEFYFAAEDLGPDLFELGEPDPGWGAWGR